MNTKLTLRLDSEAINRGKQFAKQQGTSLSQLVQEYFLLLGDNDNIVEMVPVSAKLHSLLGIGSDSYDETDYLTHLIEKHN